MTARILTVCTGNICRSPLAEGLLRAGLEGLPVMVESAGTHAMDGEPATPETVELGRRLGAVGVGEHRARYLTEQILDGVDLVLTMTVAHTEAVLRLAPSLTKRTFTIREFAKLLEIAELESIEPVTSSEINPTARVRSLAERLSWSRGTLTLIAELDVIDPYQRNQRTYEQAATQLGPPAARASEALAKNLI